jgi:hypothetical protein
LLPSGAVSPNDPERPIDAGPKGILVSCRREVAQPSAWVSEDHNIAVMNRHQSWFELVHDDSVVDLQRVFHQRGRDVEGAREEHLDQERDEHSDQENADDIADESPRPLDRRTVTACSMVGGSVLGSRLPTRPR